MDQGHRSQMRGSRLRFRHVAVCVIPTFTGQWWEANVTMVLCTVL